MLEKAPENGNKRNIVFWYDAKKEFEEEIDNLSLGNARVLKLTNSNSFRIKHIIESEDTESNFLIYSPDEKPENRHNWLLDISKYSQEFNTDRAVYEMRRMGLEDDALLPVFKKNIGFFGNKKRVDKLQSFEIKECTPEYMETAFVSALFNMKAPDLDEIVRKLMAESLANEQKLIGEVRKYGDLNALYDILRSRFGYSSEVFDMEEFIAMLMYTDFSYDFKGKLPKELDSLRSKKMSEVVVFMDELLSNSNYRDTLEQLSEKYEEKLKIRELIESSNIEDFISCDSFKAIDEVIIGRIVRNIIGGVEEYDRYIGYHRDRRTKCWYSSFRDEYLAVVNAIELIRLCRKWKGNLAMKDAAEYFTSYADSLHMIDQHYRKFYFHYDRIENKDIFSDLNELVENSYVNGYLDDLSINWSGQIASDGGINLDMLSFRRQWNFYDDFVRKHVDSNDRVFVIISDSMRYEIASELSQELEKERRCEVGLSPAVGVVPSYTHFGMAALLPHREAMLSDKLEIAIDGVSSVSTQGREKILQNAHPDAIAVRHSGIKHLKKDELKELMSGKKLIYVYHDTIDEGGHSGSPFQAAETAIEEIKSLVRMLVNYVSATKIIITADHGFIYQRSKLKEYDKLSKLKTEAILEADRRYMISTEGVDDMNLMALDFERGIKGAEGLKVIVPKGTMRLKTQGDEGNYVHGGASLQEIVIPVIEYVDKRNDDYKARKVEVKLTSISRKLTNRITYLEFFQTESVGDKKLPASIRLYFVDEAGSRVSNEAIIIADSPSSVPGDRMYKEKFVLKDQKYSREGKYYLVIEDDEEKINPLIEKIPFYIDLAIVNDFGF